MKKWKRVVIKEELVALTNDYKLAIVLNQLLYWSERVADFEQFMLEEKERLKMEKGDNEHLSCKHGWIYKSAAQLAEECMMTHSETTMRRYLDVLVKKGWIMQRANPIHKWDKTLQYRVNVHKIQGDLLKIGYSLEDYPLIKDIEEQDSKMPSEETCIKEDVPSISSHPRVFRHFEKYGFGHLTKDIAKMISTWVEKLSEDIVMKAMEVSFEKGKRNWNYVQAVLRDWKKRGLKTVSQVEEYVSQHLKTTYRRKEMLPKWMGEEYEAPVFDEAFYEEKKRLEERIKAYKQRKKQQNMCVHYGA